MDEREFKSKLPPWGNSKRVYAVSGEASMFVSLLTEILTAVVVGFKNTIPVNVP